MGPKSKIFAQKSTVVKWNCCILWIDIEWGLQKLDLILESKVVQKLSLFPFIKLTKMLWDEWFAFFKIDTDLGNRCFVKIATP